MASEIKWDTRQSIQVDGSQVVAYTNTTMPRGGCASLFRVPMKAAKGRALLVRVVNGMVAGVQGISLSDLQAQVAACRSKLLVSEIG